MNEQRPPPPPVGPTRRSGSLPRTIRAVAWSLIGLRKGAEYEQDLQKINPVHLFIVGLLAVFLLVGLLILLVNWVVRA
ncbi:DUF2970 domain-containing protein [Acidovorax sp. Leaf160]|uniref:DUF2970 domain-containing protein n=1 Tax=Acidovorax sp. Leaf160 TaxID=1736280 RepID=UPI0006FB7853|nr:DUF2970 domain-containing protein [Acidovorax sp. Leaf160]KQR60802.1 hypothetical protein ASF94_17490 [Acidovorax sp. Leaf160]